MHYRKDGEETRHKILKVASMLFAEKGTAECLRTQLRRNVFMGESSQ
ncbi:MAG: hypothetical protein NT118_08765 [Lentisphaerae bacterium]|nr:hypothetical protein [Lentisphaerota bacterium]